MYILCINPAANFQYAVTFHNERECQACLMENITAYVSLHIMYTVEELAIGVVHLHTNKHVCMYDIHKHVMHTQTMHVTTCLL